MPIDRIIQQPHNVSGTVPGLAMCVEVVIVDDVLMEEEESFTVVVMSNALILAQVLVMIQSNDGKLNNKRCL